MTRKKCLLEEFLKNPESLKYCKIEKLLKYYGFRKASIRGSHRKFRHELLKENLTIPVHHNDCEKVYKIIAAKCLRKIYE